MGLFGASKKELKSKNESLQKEVESLRSALTPEQISLSDVYKRQELGYGRINVKDEPTRYELVPVWHVFGYENSSRDERSDKSNHSCLLMINAIDGTIIDRDYGY